MSSSLPQKPLAFILRFLRPHYAGTLGLVALAVIASVAEGLQPYNVKLMIDAVGEAHDPSTITGSLLKIGAFFLLLRLLIVGSWWSFSTVWQNIAPRVEASIRKRLFEHVLGHPYVWFLNSFSGRTGHRIDTAARAFTSLYYLVNGRLIYVIVRSLTIFGMLILIDRWLGLGMLLWAVVFIPVTLRFSQKTDQQSSRWIAANGRHTERVVDAVSSIFNVRTNGASVLHEQAESSRRADEAAVENRELSVVWRRSDLIRTNLNTMLYCALFLIGMWRYQTGVISLGDYALAISASIGLVDTLGDFSKTWQRIAQDVARQKSQVNEDFALT